MLEAGTFLSDRYEIIEKIGAGGMSDVYKAKDQVLGREVAVKVLKAEFSDDMGFVTKFKTEASSAAGLEHPNIVNIYDVGSEDGLYFIVMEYIEGITLKTYIEKKGQLNYKEVISIAIQVGRGIESAHNKGIIHRDIKPQNIIISREGKVKVTDFGIARATSGNTISADVMGSVHYASPEQARNGYVNEQSDIYSLGIVMYEMATGRLPFDGETAVAVAIQHLQGEMVPPTEYAPDLPISIERIIEKSTMKNPDRRYVSMGDLLIDLKKALINPNEDFVTIVGADSQEQTRVISREEVEQIREEANRIEIDDEIEPDENEDEEVNPKMEKAITILGVAAAVLIAFILLYILGSSFGWISISDIVSGFKSETSSEEVTVPDLTGKTVSEAESSLSELGLSIENIGTVSSDSYEEGQIVTQSVEAGSTAEAGSTVQVTVSSGSGDTEVPSVVGFTESTAITTLKNDGFKYNVEYEYSTEVNQGQVIAQSPEAGEAGKSGDIITITVSQGTESVQVPDVIGKSQEDATSDLESKGLVVSSVTTQYSNTVANGYVISQGTAAGKYIEAGSGVSLVVSIGSQASYYCLSNFYCNQDGAYVLKDSAGNTLDSWTATAGEYHSKSNLSVALGVITKPDGSVQTVTLTRQ